MKLSRLLLIFIFILASTSFVKAQNIDASKSEIAFKITGAGFFKVKGTFKGMQGDFNFNENDLDNAGFNICIDTKTINTGNNKRDDHLRAEDFFSVDEYPTICFVSTSVSIENNTYFTTGELTMHGMTKTVKIPFEFKNNTFIGDFEIERLDYNIGEDTSTFTVGSTAKITITCVVN